MTPLAVLDLDGTLVDSAPLCASILNAMLDHRGLDRRLSVDETRPHVTAGGRMMIASLLNLEGGQADVALSEFRQRYAQAPTPSDSLYAGVLEGIHFLRDAGIGVAIWSNKPQPLCDKVVGDLGLAELCAAVVGTGPGVPHKPNAAGYELALTLAGGVRHSSCLIGDTEIDGEAALGVGVPFVWVSYGYGACAPQGALVADDFIQASAMAKEMLCR